jgi:hypothetical protein
MRPVTTTVYVANDGTPFMSEAECLNHKAKAELDDAFECAYMYGEYRFQSLRDILVVLENNKTTVLTYLNSL